jgi:hypothetical protein
MFLADSLLFVAFVPAVMQHHRLCLRAGAGLVPAEFCF